MHEKLKNQTHTNISFFFQESPDEVNFFYIRSQNVSHRIKANSRDPDKNGVVTSIDTVITRSDSDCEVVFKTVVSKSDNGNLRTPISSALNFIV